MGGPPPAPPGIMPNSGMVPPSGMPPPMMGMMQVWDDAT